MGKAPGLMSSLWCRVLPCGQAQCWMSLPTAKTNLRSGCSRSARSLRPQRPRYAYITLLTGNAGKDSHHTHATWTSHDLCLLYKLNRGCKWHLSVIPFSWLTLNHNLISFSTFKASYLILWRFKLRSDVFHSRCIYIKAVCLFVQLEEGKMMERRKKIALELSELVIYCRPVPFDEDSKDCILSLEMTEWHNQWHNKSSPNNYRLLRSVFSPYLLQKLAQNGPVSGTCHPFLRPRQKSTSTRSRERSSCSTIDYSCPGSTPEARD